MNEYVKALKHVLLLLRIWFTDDKNIKMIKEINDAIWGSEK